MTPRFWPFHRHRWTAIEAIGRIVTYRCPCGRAKTRVR